MGREGERQRERAGVVVVSEMEGAPGCQTGLKESEIITVSADSPLTSQREEERGMEGGESAGGMLHYITIKRATQSSGRAGEEHCSTARTETASFQHEGSQSSMSMYSLSAQVQVNWT